MGSGRPSDSVRLRTTLCWTARQIKETSPVITVDRVIGRSVSCERRDSTHLQISRDRFMDTPRSGVVYQWSHDNLLCPDWGGRPVNEYGCSARFVGRYLVLVPDP